MLSGASAAPGQGSAGGVAAGLEMLWSDLANCPALGAQGVLASVRVKDGRLVGTQGLARELRKQHGTRVPYKVRCGDGVGRGVGRAAPELRVLQGVGVFGGHTGTGKSVAQAAWHPGALQGAVWDNTEARGWHEMRLSANRSHVQHEDSSSCMLWYNRAGMRL
jgi:hypothetical protein